jgi:hypothetical protein
VYGERGWGPDQRATLAVALWEPPYLVCSRQIVVVPAENLIDRTLYFVVLLDHCANCDCSWSRMRTQCTTKLVTLNLLGINAFYGFR